MKPLTNEFSPYFSIINKVNLLSLITFEKKTTKDRFSRRRKKDEGFTKTDGIKKKTKLNDNQNNICATWKRERAKAIEKEMIRFFFGICRL